MLDFSVLEALTIEDILEIDEGLSKEAFVLNQVLRRCPPQG